MRIEAEVVSSFIVFSISGPGRVRQQELISRHPEDYRTIEVLYMRVDLAARIGRRISWNQFNSIIASLKTMSPGDGLRLRVE